MIKIVFLLFLIGHVLADFYLQTANLALEKDLYFSKLLKHSLIYLLTMIVMIIPVLSVKLLLWAIMIGFVHFAIDFIKFILKNKFTLSSKLETIIFFIDQIVHIVTVFVVTVCISYFSVPIKYLNWFDSMVAHVKTDFQMILSWVLIILIIMTPFSIVIKKVLFHYKPTDDEHEGHPNAGALIGILERALILLFLSVGQYSAIGFVLTAKSIARYNKMADDPTFSEYYLLGTLLSSLLVIIAYLLIF